MPLKFALAAVIALSFSAAPALADEGLQRITTLGDQDLVAQAKAKQRGGGASQQPQQKRYKSVEDEDSGREYFKGSPFPQSNNVFFGLGFNYFDAFGLQARYASRVVEKGFLPNLNNSFYVEGGIGLTFYGTVQGKSGVSGISFIATGRWDFQFDPTWTFFGNAGLGFNAVTDDKQDHVKGGGIFPAIGVGAMYNLDSEWAFRGDLSYQFFGVGMLHRF